MNSAMPTVHDERPRILCVDDEQAVLEGLELSLGRRFDVHLAAGADAALSLLERRGPFAVVISDMRMPGMNGAALLAAVRERQPLATRMLLTGFAEMEAAIAAVNEGQIFRFLTKPCPAEALRRAVDDAVAHHRLLLAEKALLQQTLRGAVQTLCEVLAIADPSSFGRTERLRKRVLDVAAEMQFDGGWELELAVMLLGLGRVGLPAGVANKLDTAEPLDELEQTMVARVPALTDQLLAPIPRLETVREIQRRAQALADPAAAAHNAGDNVERASRILRAVLDYEACCAHGDDPTSAVGTLRARATDPDTRSAVEALARVLARARDADEVRSLSVEHLRAGMVLAEDLRSDAGQLLIRSGYPITTALIERLRNLRAWALHEPIRVLLPRSETPTRATGS